MGIKLVSASENIDDTPAGQLMHGMLASFAEYYSNNLASEIMKGLTRKHEQGGTPFKPPIGYLSKRELIGSQDIRSVIVDPVRAPLVQLAFTLYSTGEWPLHRLADHLEEQGLRSRGTERYPERPLGHNRIHKMLRNPYYMGIVGWNDKRYPGKHDRLVSEDIFDRVQALLSVARVSGDRPQKHEHYLRGTVVCDECLGRLLYGRHRGRGGRQYEYFCCNNRAVRRRKTKCSSSHASVPTVDERIQEHYRSVRIAPEVQEQIRAELRDELSDRSALIEREAERHAEITGTTLTPVYAALSAWQPGLGQPAASQPQSQSRLGKGDFQPTAAPVHRTEVLQTRPCRPPATSGTLHEASIRSLRAGAVSAFCARAGRA